jgi:hypothetical protein
VVQAVSRKYHWCSNAKDGEAEDGDAAIIAQLKMLGADLERPREAWQYLYVPAQNASHQTAETLRQDGYRAVGAPPHSF